MLFRMNAFFYVTALINMSFQPGCEVLNDADKDNDDGDNGNSDYLFWPTIFQAVCYAWI